MKKQKTLQKIQLFWGFFIGVGAYFGAYMMISEPSGVRFGMSPMLPSFQVLPFADLLFQNFLVSGILLLIVNGLSNTISVILLLKGNKYGALSGLLCGIILMLWITVQFVIFDFNFMSFSYFIFGILQALNGWLLIKCTKN
ncbi:MAG: hypothetical protein LBN95_06205 [Prevotellaceae bacterium]|jgi:hypothetical protein|nr:hypothetical protein [Prevotellaceae bacterium]